jgi:hypothetical protein
VMQKAASGALRQNPNAIAKVDLCMCSSELLTQG